MGNLVKVLKISAYIAEAVIAGSVVIELVEKYCGKKKVAASKTGADNNASEKQ